jgi:hypothetical protein
MYCIHCSASSGATIDETARPASYAFPRSVPSPVPSAPTAVLPAQPQLTAPPAPVVLADDPSAQPQLAAPPIPKVSLAPTELPAPTARSIAVVNPAHGVYPTPVGARSFRKGVSCFYLQVHV